ncbi:MAG TPA: phosphoglycerate mutase family protein [Pyrinomonadaceae bacterium]|nr:phosphoglycerate mutase family protein [Pyrinomonadaceae bacterium]
MKVKPLILCVLLLLVAVASPAAVAQEEFKPVTVFLIRHAEKEDEPRQDPPLKKEGVVRSQELARLLSNAGIKAIFTSQFTRTKQTAEPLATKLGLTATPFTLKSNPSNPRQIAAESTAEVTNKILERAGESVLVVGHSNSIPDVIKMLGGDIVPTIDERKFDDLFVVTVYAKGKARVVQMKYGAE